MLNTINGRLDLYSLPNENKMIRSRRNRLKGHVAAIGRREIHIRGLVGNSEGKRPLERTRCKQEGNEKWILEK
jgi:hypothetical protein